MENNTGGAYTLEGPVGEGINYFAIELSNDSEPDMAKFNFLSQVLDTESVNGKKRFRFMVTDNKMYVSKFGRSVESWFETVYEAMKEANVLDDAVMCAGYIDIDPQKAKPELFGSSRSLQGLQVLDTRDSNKYMNEVLKQKVEKYFDVSSRLG